MAGKPGVFECRQTRLPASTRLRKRYNCKPNPFRIGKREFILPLIHKTILFLRHTVEAPGAQPILPGCAHGRCRRTLRERLCSRRDYDLGFGCRHGKSLTQLGRGCHLKGSVFSQARSQPTREASWTAAVPCRFRCCRAFLAAQDCRSPRRFATSWRDRNSQRPPAELHSSGWWCRTAFGQTTTCTSSESAACTRPVIVRGSFECKPSLATPSRLQARG
jgi:hypothetical protein